MQKMNGCLVSTVARAIGSGGVVIGAVIVGNVVSRVIITETVMLGGLSCWWRGGGCVEIHSDGTCGVRGCRVCVCIEEGYSIRGCRVEGCRGGVTVLRGYGVRGCCEGRAYVNDVMGGVCWWSELMRLRKRTMELRDWILWKCVTRNTILGIAVWDCVATGVTEVGEKAGG